MLYLIFNLCNNNESKARNLLYGVKGRDSTVEKYIVNEEYNFSIKGIVENLSGITWISSSSGLRKSWLFHLQG